MKIIVVACAAFNLVVGGAAAKELTVTYGDVIKPDAELKAFIDSFANAISAKKPDYKAIDGFFAPSMGSFSRSLDPLQPWFKAEPITANHLDEIIDVIVEQAPLPDDVKQPDYRPEALSMMAAMLKAGPLGSIKEAKGQACAPASYKFDRKAVTAFVKASKDSINGFRFYKQNIQLLEKPQAVAGKAAVLPAGTLVTLQTDENLPDGWAKLTGLGGGISGYMKDNPKNPEYFLNQMHVCFGKVSGQYKVTSIFGYGL